MNSSQYTSVALSTLPPDVSVSLQALSRSGELAHVWDQDDEDDEQFISDAGWPSSSPPPTLSQAPPPVYSSQAGTTVHSSQASQAIQRRSSLISASLSDFQRALAAGDPHWDPKSLEILAKAVLNRNPNLCPNNTDKATVWIAIYKEFKAAASIHNLHVRDLRTAKKKWQDMVCRCKQRDAMNIRSTGGIAYTNEVEKLLDDYIGTETVPAVTAAAAASSSAASTPTARCRRCRGEQTPVDVDQQHFAEIASSIGQTPASRSMSSLSDCSQEQLAASESGDDGLDMQVQKQSCNTTADVIGVTGAICQRSCASPKSLSSNESLSCHSRWVSLNELTEFRSKSATAMQAMQSVIHLTKLSERDWLYSNWADLE